MTRLPDKRVPPILPTPFQQEYYRAIQEEQEEADDARVEKENELIDLCNSTNAALMQAAGFTVVEFYEEYNRQWREAAAK